MIRIPSKIRNRVPTLMFALGGTMVIGCSAQDAAEVNNTAFAQNEVTSAANLDVTAGSRKIINTYAALSADASQGATTVSVAPSSLGGLNLAAGDLLMLYQPQGAQIATMDDGTYGQVTALGGAGLYEVFRTSGSDPQSGQIQLAPGCTLRNNYATAGKTQVIRVPRYKKVTVQAGQDAVPHGVLTAAPWNGSTGGVLALRADTISVDGEIDVNGIGFSGGKPNAGSGNTAADQVDYRNQSGAIGGEKGESIAGGGGDYDSLGGRYGRGAPANGGGGGNNTNSGGGGGANAGTIAAYTGDGVMANTQLYGAAWMLDPGAQGGLANSSGGGRGGYTSSSNAQNPTQVAPGNALWGGNNRRERGGRGGHPLSADAPSRVFFGGGGGSGEANNGVGGAGGTGGGLALLLSKVVTSTEGGCITAAGLPGGNSLDDGAGGGGGGGSVVFAASKINGVNVTAFGGKGGDNNTSGADMYGPGGGGGGGFVGAPMAASLRAELGGGPAGMTHSSSATAFPVNGASDGSAGVSQPYTGSLPVCLPSDVSVTYTATPTMARVNVPIRCAVQVENQGPEDAENLKLTISVPPGTTVASEPAGPGWTCKRAADVYTCTLPALAAGVGPSALSFYLAAQPTAPVTLQSKATVSADNADPNINNNTASIAVDIDRTQLRGDGFTCQAAGPGGALPGAFAQVLALFLGLGAALRRRRTGAQP